ncbi:serine hydroxymethyltransferase [Leptonema illini]|uniref:Serine hydroxymethyltransferase n=1 Tax=Leptonema illini DSM 21528 TaxID=929563 RepID=H2CGF4_9LEPT|nr:serine hydroxymethyltransferase [Leptonema illini]EHQ06869.1 serine hydroxymethyltransferase [Leptonema illini DSM 21528]
MTAQTDNTLKSIDSEVFNLVRSEESYQRSTIRLIASENYTSRAVLEACGTVFQNKYSEGYPGARFYQGQINCDALERLAIDRAKALFGAEHANVQPYSGSPANLAVYLAFAKPGDTILGLNLSHGGHLTHGSKASVTGKWFNAVHYNLNPDTGLLDYDEIRRLALEHRPKLLIAGHSAYPRQLDFAKFREIADESGAILFVDMAHFAGLVAGGAHANPVPFADVVTTTTHKTLRGPRGAMILCKEVHAKAIDKAVFPGLQGGPHNSTTGGIAVALKEAATPAFKEYAHAVVANAKTLAAELSAKGFKLVSGGTDNHLILIDLTNKGITGKEMAIALEAAGIVLNYNTVPGETRPAFDPSGIRLGTPSVTSRGFGVGEMKRIAEWMDAVASDAKNTDKLASIARDVATLCSGFPVPGID